MQGHHSNQYPLTIDENMQKKEEQQEKKGRLSNENKYQVGKGRKY